MKVAICGLLTSENLGEWFIADSLKYIIKMKYIEKKGREAGNLDFVFVDILANIDHVIPSENPIRRRIRNCYKYRMSGIPAEVIDSGIRRIARKRNFNTLHKVRHFIWNHAYNFRPRYTLYYEKMFKGVNLIVIDGAGLLEYSPNEYQEPLNLISKYGEKHNIPVVYNAIGRSGDFVPEDFRCKVLINALRSHAVKYVSARDSVDIVQQCVGNKHKVELLADAAFWCKEAYGIEKNPTANCVGIGLIRGNALQRYKVDFTEEDWLTLFENIAKELVKRGYTYFFFTNGMMADYKVGGVLCERMHLPQEKLIKRPDKAAELMNTISGCVGLITCRMHSSIAATSLGIPSVVMSWNSKIDKYFDMLGYPERAIQVKNFDAKYIVDTFECALKEGMPKQVSDKMRRLALKSVEGYIDMLV